MTGRLAIGLALARSRIAIAAALAFVALGLAGGAVPLLQAPGFELGLAGALASGAFLGPALGIAAARRELASAHAAARPPSVLRPFAAAAGVLVALLALLFGLAALRAALATPCRALAGASLFALTALPSALLAAALGVAAGVAARGRRLRAALLYAAPALVSLGTTLLAAYAGPAASAHDHLLGFWPGPIYEEAIEIDARLLLYRAGTLAWTGAALAVGALVARVRGSRGPAAAGLAAALAAALLARVAGGGDVSRGELAAALGGVREGPRCVVHYPREKSASQAERILRDCEYDAHEVARALSLARPPRATLWVHRDADEKRRLVGAGHTSFTKPWLAEIHLDDEGTPHPLLRHELVHALASAAASGPLRVPARAGAWVDGGLVEGLAVALEVPAGSFDVHGWARAMRDRGLLPPLTSLVGAGGFFGTAPARAYAAAGSFVRFLLDRDGPAPVLAAYRTDDLPRALGRSLPALDAEWNRFLDGVPVSPALAAAAEARFQRDSLFARACAREVASLEHEAARAAERRSAGTAEALLRRAGALSHDPAALGAAAEAWRAAGDDCRAEPLLREALAESEATGARRALRARLLAALGDASLRRGRAADAASSYRLALALGPEGAEARTLRAKLALAADPKLRADAGPWLLGVGDPALALARLARSADPLARYLLARAILARGAPAHALEVLGGLERGGALDGDFRAEAARMHAEALCLTGRWDEGTARFRSQAAAAPTPAGREQALDAARRCAFERDEYAEPVTWEGDWDGK